MLDRTAPEAPTVVMGQDSINAATAGAVGFTINWTATDVVGYRYVFSDDTAAHDVDVEVAVVAGTTEATVSNVDLTGLDDGPITLTVTVKDSAENEGEYVNATLTKDTGIPDDPTVTGLGPINATTAGAVGFTISWTATDVVGYRYVFSDGVDVVEGSDTFAAGPTEATVSNVNLTGLDDGPITLTVTVKDGAENEGEYVNATLTKDTGIPDDPTVTGLGPINAATAGAVGFTINWTATDVVGYRYVFSDGVDDVEGSDTFAAGPTEVTVSNADLTGLDDGSITLTVTVKDSAENEGEYVNATLTKDTGIPDDPTVTGLGPINATTAGAVGFTINWTATDVVGYRYVFSDDTAAHDVDVEVAVVAGTTEATVSNVDLTGLDDGPITLTVTVKDSAENEGEYVDATLTKDTGIPDDPTVTGLGPINATNAGAVGFTIDWTATDVVGYRYVFSDGVDDVEGSDTFAAGPTEATVSNVDLTGLDDGPITLTVTVKDGAENEGEYVDATLTKDTGIPDDPTVTGLGPINATTAGAVGFTINWTATDVVGYRYVFSDGVDDVEGSDTFAAGPTEATVSNVDLTGLDDGSITLTVTVKDGAENEGEYVDATLTKDTGIPDDPTVTGLGPINATTAGAVGFTISWIATDVVGYRYVFSDGVDVVEGSDTFAAGPTEVTVSNVDLTGLDDGSITLTVTVKDGAENEGEYVDATLTKDTGIPDDPTVTGLGPINAATAGAVGFTINWTATDVVGYRYVFSDGVDDVEGSDTFAAGPTEATVSNVNLTGLDDGPITLTVTVKDGAENEGEYVNATLTKDTGIPDDPTVTGLGPINATTAGAVGFTINWTATDVVGYRYVFSDGVDDVEGSDTFAAGPTEATVSNVNLTGLDDGPITLTVTVKDGAENEGEYVNATLTKDTGIPDDPTVTGLGPINAATAGAVGFTINWTATDVDGYRYVFSDGVDDVEGSDTFAAGPTEVTVSNADLTGLDDGSITLTVTVKDSAENEGEYVNATLTKDTGIPDDPTVTGLGPINAATAGAVGFTINWTATDVVGYRYVFSDGVDDVEGSDTFAAGPTEVTVSNADLTGLDDGSITLTVTVKDGAENEGEYVDATLTKDTTVIGVNRCRIRNGGAAATSLSDDTITWTNSSDEEGDTLTYYAVLAKGTTATTVSDSTRRRISPQARSRPMTSSPEIEGRFRRIL
jgi:Cu/Ag efflux protein CusF